jgi:uncharacterized small protein (DUF1192 family)
MSNTEERVRATEAAERAALVADYESRIAALLAEVERMRHELAHRTAAMAAEMDRWAAAGDVGWQGWPVHARASGAACCWCSRWLYGAGYAGACRTASSWLLCCAGCCRLKPLSYVHAGVPAQLQAAAAG